MASPAALGLILFLFLACAGWAVAGAAFHVSPSGDFVDAQGRTRIFHGVNVVAKTAPYAPTTGAFDPFSSMVEEDYVQLQQWGFNMLRLGVMWPGVEPTQGQFNASYLAAMHAIVDAAGRHGIVSLLDFHQVPALHLNNVSCQSICLCVCVSVCLCVWQVVCLSVCLPASHRWFVNRICCTRHCAGKACLTLPCAFPHAHATKRHWPSWSTCLAGARPCSNTT